VSGSLVTAFARNLETMLADRAPAEVAAPEGPAGSSAPGRALPEPETSLRLGSIVASVVTTRLRSPRVIGAALVAAGVLAALLWARSG
jgi:hypothetical protein